MPKRWSRDTAISKRVDRLLPGSIWNEPEDWMMGLKQKERQLQASWGTKERSQLKNGVRQILLTARALNSSEGYLILQYSFENFASCERELDAAKNDVL